MYQCQDRWSTHLPSGVQGTWTWLCAEPQPHAPCSGPWCELTWSPDQCAHGPRCPGVYQKHHAFQSGAWQSEDQSKWWKTLYNECLRLYDFVHQSLKQPATHRRDSHLSAPAQDNILLMRMTWKGCRRMRMWKPSLPQVFTMYLLAQIRAASRATEGEGVEEGVSQTNICVTSACLYFLFEGFILQAFARVCPHGCITIYLNKPPRNVKGLHCIML